jgi:hypothetical protein
LLLARRLLQQLLLRRLPWPAAAQLQQRTH